MNSQSRFPRIFGATVCLYSVFGLVLSIAGFVHRPLRWLQRVLDLVLFPLPVGSYAWCIVLFLLGGALLARKRVGWAIMTLLMFVLNVSNLAAIIFWSDLQFTEKDVAPFAVGCVVQALILGLLLYTRPLFQARTYRGAFWHALATWVGGSVVVAGLAFLLIQRFPGRLPEGAYWPWILNHVFALALVDNAYYPGNPPRMIAFVVSTMSAVVIVASSWILMRSIRERARLSSADEDALRAMIARYNPNDSLAYFATRRDKAVVYSPDGRAAVTYRESAGVCLASGDPLGDPAAWDRAIEAWLAHAQRYGWVAAVMGASEAGARAFVRHGLSAAQLGNEAILHSQNMNLSAPEYRAVRQAVSRAKRAGVSVRVRRHSELTEEEMAEVIRRAEQWRDTTEERGFSMALSRLGDPADGDCVLVEAVQELDADGRPVADAPSGAAATDCGGAECTTGRNSPGSAATAGEAVLSGGVETPAEGGGAGATPRSNTPAEATTEGACALPATTRADGATHPRERVVGQLSFVPWGRDGLSLDLMRRSPDAPNGTVEAMVAYLCSAESIRIRRISLNFSVFQQVFVTGERLGAGPVTRFNRKVLVFLSRWWQLETLYRSNQKYLPQWAPRYLCYADPLMLPRIGIASGLAEGFIPTPLSRRPPKEGSLQKRHDPGALAAYAHVATIREELEAGLRPRRVPEQVEVRLAAAQRLSDEGVDVWPPAAPASAEAPWRGCSEVAELAAGEAATIAGRVLARRCFGGVTFFKIEDFDGCAQVIVERDPTPEAMATAERVDLADLVRVTGTAGTSRTGEKSLLATSITIESKSLHPLPDLRHGVLGETRVRDRHLDLVTNPTARSTIRARAAVLRALRQVLYGQDFMEVETPVLQPIHGGANARPFITHINAYGMQLYLRIAPELYLKRLLCGGAQRIFELGRVFRNEGVDATHNPEFTVLEAYEAHGDYRSVLRLTEELIREAATAVHGSPRIPGPDGQWVDLSGEWPVKPFYQAVSEALSERLGRDVTVGPTSDASELCSLCAEVAVPCRGGWSAGEIALELYEHLVEDTTGAPTFYTDFPTSVSPLTRAHRSEEGVAERWDLVAFGVELGTGYTELTNPCEQRARLEEQSLAAAGGDPEAMEVDEDFLRALEFGMPPTGGLGLGVDRVIMLITGATIRESLAFPLVKPVER